VTSNDVIVRFPELRDDSLMQLSVYGMGYLECTELEMKAERRVWREMLIEFEYGV